MTTIGHVAEIETVKRQLDELKDKGVVREWELPYENLLTRLTAAIFFLTPASESGIEEIWTELGRNDMFQYRPNEEKKLSQLEWRVEFNKEFSLHG